MIKEQRVNVWFSNKDMDVIMGLNKMSLSTERSKNWIIKKALEKFLISEGYINKD